MVSVNLHSQVKSFLQEVKLKETKTTATMLNKKIFICNTFFRGPNIAQFISLVAYLLNFCKGHFEQLKMHAYLFL